MPPREADGIGWEIAGARDTDGRLKPPDDGSREDRLASNPPRPAKVAAGAERTARASDPLDSPKIPTRELPDGAKVRDPLSERNVRELEGAIAAKEREASALLWMRELALGANRWRVPREPRSLG
jgi:hypothetical protein